MILKYLDSLSVFFYLRLLRYIYDDDKSPSLGIGTWKKFVVDMLIRWDPSLFFMKASRKPTQIFFITRSKSLPFAKYQELPLKQIVYFYTLEKWAILVGARKKHFKRNFQRSWNGQKVQSLCVIHWRGFYPFTGLLKYFHRIWSK